VPADAPGGKGPGCCQLVLRICLRRRAARTRTASIMPKHGFLIRGFWCGVSRHHVHGFVQSGSGERSGQTAVRSVPRRRPGGGDDAWAAARPGVRHDRRRRVACRGRARLAVARRVRTRCRAPGDGSHGRMRRGAGNCRSIACSVNRFVNRTQRDRTRRGRRSRPTEMGPGLSAEVTTSARDCPRRQRHTSYGS
jgi:hypothetical protein